MQSVTLLKLGGSLITDKSRPLTPRMETLVRLAEEIQRAGLIGSLILGHGSGSFGHVTAAKHSIHLGVETAEQVEGVAATQNHTHRLHRLVMETLWKAGNQVFSIVPSSNLTAVAARPEAFAVAPVLGALRLGLVPVTFGDVVIDSEWGASICSTEQVFEALVESLGASGTRVERVLWLGATDGIHDAAGVTVAEIHAGNRPEMLAAAGVAAGEDVTGGMRLRLETACRLADRGIPSWIGNGLEPGRLLAALQGEDVLGTLVLP